MQKLRKIIDSLTSTIVYASALAVIGIAFIILRGTPLDVVIIAVGSYFALAGILGIIAALLGADHSPITSLFGYGAIFKSSLTLFFGISMIAVRSAAPGILCNFLGGILTAYSLFKLARPSHRLAPRTREWYIESVIYSVLSVFGLFVMLIPVWPYTLAGISMLLLGGKWLYDEIRKRIKAGKSAENSTRVSPSRQKRGKSGGDIYTNDFVDKSN